MKKYKYLKYQKHVLTPVFYGVLVGALTGALIFAFKLTSEKLVHISHTLYVSAGKNALYVPLAFAMLCAFAFIMYMIQRREPSLRGGGIPRSEGIMRGMLDFKAARTLVGTVICALISFFSGLPLGSEGPSVLIGTSVGRLISPKRAREAKSRFIMTGGAAAGFAVATGAPVSAVLFILEEVHKRTTPLIILMASSASVSATIVNYILSTLFGVRKSLFDIPTLASFKLSQIGYVLLLSLFISLALAAFDVLVSLFDTVTDRLEGRLHALVKLLPIFIITGAVGLIYPDALFGGASIVEKLLTDKVTLLFLSLLLLWRFVMMILISESGATGGTFVPTLAIGALVGALGARLLVYIGMPEGLQPMCIVISMCAFLGGVLRAPLCSIVFFAELTGLGGGLLYVSVAVFLTYMTSVITSKKSLYETILEDMFIKQNRGKARKIYRFEAKISENSFVAGKSVRDVLWPHTAVVTSIIKAHERTMDDEGEAKMHVGDKLILRIEAYDVQKTLDTLYDLIGRDFEIVYNTI